MKKRLLITSIVMMLVVAVALSTATYAWFTSNNSVTASSITMTATTSNTASLAIAWLPSEAAATFSSSIESDTVSTEFFPAAPTTVASNTSLASFTFGSSTIKTINGLNYFNADGGEVTAATTNSSRAYLWTGLNGGSTTIQLKNMSAAQTSRTITVTAAITDNDENGSNDDGIGLIRVAIFQGDKLVGIMANSAATVAWGTIAAPSSTPTEYETAEVKMHISGNSAAETPVVTTSATQGSVGLPLGTLAAGATTNINVVVWMDGQALGDSQGGLAAKVALTFTEAAAPQNP